MQRYVRLFGTPITMLLLLALLLYGAWWGKKQVTAPIPPKPATPCATQNVGSSLDASEVTVKVVNGGSHSGLAAQVSTQLSNAGFQIAGVGNTDTHTTTTQVIGASATDPEVKLVLGFFKQATAVADQRVDHTVEVRVGNSYAGMNANAPTHIAIKGGQVCLPASPAPKK